MRIIAGVIAAILFFIAGAQMVTLVSETGNTVAEAFYHSMGWFSFGLGALALTVALPAESLNASAWFVSSEQPAARRPAGAVGIAAVAGWNPIGARICPSCASPVSLGHNTQCDNCGAQLVVPAVGSPESAG
ncbi:MAG: hypothetical protein QOF49_354 [Chloroflexota bacterium]|jgi:hypothetical protein|nr:hypothetical protein [Chloroflexota bacterium]